MWMLAALALVASFGSAECAAASRVEKVTCRVELDRGILPAGASQRAVVKVSLDAPLLREKAERPPVNLAIVLDRSGSMSGGGKLEKAKEAAIAALRRLGERDLFSLVIFDHEVETLVPPQSAGNTEWIESRINSIRSRGNTALFGGVSQGAAEVRKHLEGRYVSRILLLSDGQANVGPSQPEDLGRLGAALMKEHIAVTTIGVGTDYNEDLMTKLAQNSDGNTYFVESSSDLPRIFAAELGDVLNVFAREVRLEIEFSDGVRPVRIIGRDGRLDDRKVEIRLNQLYGGQAKYALVEVEVSAGAPRDVRKLASARCSYENLVSRQAERAEAEANVRFSDSAPEVTRSVNVSVQKDMAYNILAEARDEAIQQADKGERVKAAATLRAAGAKVQAQASAYNINDDALNKDADGAAQAAAAIETHGLDNMSRKAMRTDSYQMRNQQQKQ
jgi:Ca-activated chloride channel family protein